MDGPAETIALGGLTLATTASAGQSGPVVCVLDGRPDVTALVAELELDPRSSPAEAVAAGYLSRGEAVLDRLSGPFALAVWNRDGSHGVIARHRTAARPLFTVERDGALLFASEIRNLLALLPSRPAPDPDAMTAWLARSPLPEDRTLHSGIRRVRPGHAVQLGSGTWRTLRFWEPKPPRTRSIDAAEAAHELRAALGCAVDRALAGAARPGLLLSGGLDSAAVAAAARPRVTAYSGVFPDRPAVDESERIRAVREHLGLPGVELELGGGSALEAAREFVREWKLPPATPNRFVWAPLLDRAAADGVDVMLDGEGGDELFGCARYLVADRLLAGRPLGAVAVARRLPGMGSAPRPRWIGRALLVYGARAALPHRLHERLRAARGRSGGPPWLADAVLTDRWAWKRGPGPRWWAQLADVLTADRLGVADQLRRELAMHGLEPRHPLSDPELIDLVLSLPPEHAFDPHMDRPLARRALAGELPDAVLASDAKPFFNELLEGALAGPDAAPLRALVADPHPELAARLRLGAAKALADPGQPPRGPRALELWRLATLQLWLEDGSG